MPWVRRQYGGRILLLGAGVVAGALAFGPGYAGYDVAWALVWGADVAGGSRPDYEASFAPTPHPLANAVAVPLSLFEDGGVVALLALSNLRSGFCSQPSR